MVTYALRRILQLIPLLLLITVVIYGLTALQPGDPVDVQCRTPRAGPGGPRRAGQVRPGSSGGTAGRSSL